MSGKPPAARIGSPERNLGRKSGWGCLPDWQAPRSQPSF